MRRIRFSRVALALLAAFPFSGPAAGDPAPPAMPQADRIALAEAYRLADAIGDSIWPGWSRVPFATVLVAGEHEYFVRHPNPPSGTTPLGRDALLGSDVFVRARTFQPGFLATFPVEGISTVVVGTPEATGSKSPTDWIVTLLHEHFHQLQEAQPGYYDKAAALGLARGDQTGMWMLNFPFPYDTPKVQRAYAKAAAALLEALGAKGSDAVMDDYREARRSFRATLPDDDRKYMDFQLWKEGVARYTQIRVAKWAAQYYEPTPEVRALPGYVGFDVVTQRLADQIRKELQELRLADAKRTVFYPYGAAEALKLDDISVSWRDRYFKDLFTFDDPAFGPPRSAK
jgi:hypothetical protein